MNVTRCVFVCKISWLKKKIVSGYQGSFFYEKCFKYKKHLSNIHSGNIHNQIFA